MTYRLIALDVDGTLLNDKYELTDGVRDAVAEAHRQGAVVVLATGRSATNTMPLLSLLGLEGIMITHNGAAVVDSRTREVLHRFPFEYEEIEPVIEYCRKHGIHFDVCTPFDLFVEKITPVEQEMYDRFMLKPVVRPGMANIDGPKVKMSIFAPADKLDQLQVDWPQIGSPLRIIRSGLKFVDVMNPEATKGNALKELAADYGMPREHVLAIGNYFNDLAMIEWAGLGIAMANSPQEVLDRADAVTASNNEDGVAAAIRQYVLSPDK